MLVWNLVIRIGNEGYIPFNDPLESLEALSQAIKQANLSKPEAGAFIAVQYDPEDQHDPTGVKTSRVVAINQEGEVVLEYKGVGGILVSNPPLTHNK